MRKNIFIAILFVTTIIFAVLFLVYYNKIDEYKKDKEIYLNNKEAELTKREKRLVDMEECNQKLDHCLAIKKQIQEILGPNVFKCNKKHGNHNEENINY